MSSRAKRQLDGTRILVGRARHQAGALADGLRALGAEVIEIPFIEIRQPSSYQPLDTALKNHHTYDWLILTSVNGVDAVAARMKKLRLKASEIKSIQIAAIGPATAERIRSLGLRVAVVPKQYVAESVVDGLRHKVKGKRILLARAKVARDVIPRELRRAGATVTVVEAYQTVVPAKSRRRLRQIMNQNKRPDIVAFTSSSTVKNFVALLGRRDDSLEGIQMASIGPITSATLKEHELPVDIEASQYTIPGLIRAIRAARR